MSSLSAASRGNPEYRHLIDFVKPGQSGVQTKKRRPRIQSSVGGNEAKSFYEELCQDSVSNDSEHSTQLERSFESRRKKRGKREKRDIDRDSRSASKAKSSQYCFDSKAKPNQRVLDHKKSEFLRLAQNGDVEAVKLLLEQGVDVNGTDLFGWTASMSAAFEGHVDVLNTLVKSGADMTVRNFKGQTALSLAQQKGHRSVLTFLESHQRVGLSACSTRSRGMTLTDAKVSRFYCDVCKSEFMDTDQSTHSRTVVHIFNTGAKPKDDFFLIPPSNVGFKLMLKTGWDGNKGLGPSGQGQKFPVKTVLKRNRHGLGSAVTDKAKVTHYKAGDESAVARGHGQWTIREANVRTLSRRAQRVKERRDRRAEIDLRHQLS